MGAVDKRELLIADSQFGSGQLTGPTGTILTPATWYLGLSVTAPNEDGTNFTEPVGAAYARAAVTNNFTNFPSVLPVAGITTKKNGTVIAFPNPTGLWGAIIYYGWFVVATGDTPHWINPLDTPITVQAGNSPVQFDVGQLVMAFD